MTLINSKIKKVGLKQAPSGIPVYTGRLAGPDTNTALAQLRLNKPPLSASQNKRKAAAQLVVTVHKPTESHINL